MPNAKKFPVSLFAVLTAGPALIVGAGLWWLGGLAPICELDIHQSLASPDARFDLVVFSRNCADSTGANTQAALIPAGSDLPEDAASFASIGVKADLAPRWDGFGNIELTLPETAEIYRQDDTVAGVTVIYR